MNQYKKLVVILAAIAVVSGCGDSSVGTSDDSSPVPIVCDLPPIKSYCGGGLASQDLAGNCRSNPPTMGALEAIS
jgi:hypothetical protein